MKYLFPIFLFTSFFASAQSTETIQTKPSLNFNLISAYNSIDSFDEAFVSYGLGAEAKMSKRFSLAGNITFGEEDFWRFVIIQPSLKFYPSNVFKGIFVKTGFGYAKFKTVNNVVFLGQPFDADRGSSAGIVIAHAGLGFSTIVKEKISISLSIAAQGSIDIDADGSGFQSDFSIGYAF